MQENRETHYIEPAREAGGSFLARNLSGKVVMLNMLRFRDVTDYSASPELTPQNPISGAEAFQLYIEHTMPHLQKAGGELIFMGTGGKYLIGPSDGRWDLVMLVRHRSVEDFMSFASNEAYMGGICHRTAAIEDSRLLPLVEESVP